MQIWGRIYETLSNEMDNDLKSGILDNMVFKEILNNDTIVLNAPGDFVAGWFKDNILEHAQEIAFRIFEKHYRFQIEVSPTSFSHTVAEKKEEQMIEKQKTVKTPNQKLNLNPLYTFDRYISGQENEWVYAAAKTVAQSPGQTYNPLFIHGPSSLGKTHLLHAIAHHILENNPNANILYVTAAQFVNEFVDANLKKTWANFRKKYHNLDVLLIDDIQFFQKKEQSLDELFHTFEALHQNRKLMAFACDRKPGSLVDVDERLRTRFDSGMTVEVKMPNLETRKAILLQQIAEEDQKLGDGKNLQIPDSIVDFIAEKIDSNVRTLTAQIPRLILYSEVKRKNISLTMAKELLHDQIKVEPPQNLSVPKIQKVVAKFFNISVTDIKSSKRTESVAYPRQIAMFLAKEYTNLSLTEIGQMFGNKAHTTVMRSAGKIEEILRSKRKKPKREIDEIISLLSQE